MLTSPSNLVTLPFHQVVRATSPVFVVLIYRFRYGEIYSRHIYLSLVPVIVGVAFATYGDYYFTFLGLIVTLLGSVVAAIKTVVTNRLQTGSRSISTLELLYWISPSALAQSLLLAYLSGEMAAIHLLVYPQNVADILVRPSAVVFFFDGTVSALLNVVSFSTNRETGALTMAVAANIKQILTIVLGISFFRLKVEWWNALGDYTPIHSSPSSHHLYSVKQFGLGYSYRKLARHII